MRTNRPSVKQANGGVYDYFFGSRTPEQIQAQAQLDEQIKAKALKTVLGLSALGALAGGGTRLLQEAWERFGDEEDQESKQKLTAPTIKLRRPKFTKVSEHTKAALSSVEDWPLFYPLALGGTALGLYGGYTGIRDVADDLKKKELEQKLEEARQEFEDALEDQYITVRIKQSSVTSLIDGAYERWQSGALEKEALSMGQLGGLGLSGMALVWLLSHQAAYKRARKADQEAMRKKVLETQRRLRQIASPPPILAEPDDDEENQTEVFELPKAAEAIPGGMAAGRDVEDIAKLHDTDEEKIRHQLEVGTEIEKEHTPDPEESREIAKDHVVEDEKYYDPHLEDMEEEAEIENALAGDTELGDPDPSDTAAILNHVATSSDLDDTEMHKKMYERGVEPHEGEEIIYSTLQDLLRTHGDEVDPATITEREEDDEEEEGEEKEAALAEEHSCMRCEYYSNGTCDKQNEVMASDGEDNLTSYLAKLTQTNDCSQFELEGAGDEIKEAEEEEKEAAIQQPGVFDKVKNMLAKTWLDTPGAQSQLTQLANQAAQDPTTLEPAAKMLASNPNVQQGVNEATLERAKATPILGSLFGS